MSVPYHRLFHFLLYSPVFVHAPESNEARLVQRLIDAIGEYDYRTDVVPTPTGAKVAAETDMGIGCFLLSIDGPEESAIQALINTIRHERGLDTPIYLMSELKGLESLSLVPLGEVTGYVYLDHETPAFSAKETIFALERYATGLKPPFFGALMDYDYEGNQMWTCPGHQGGAFYRRSPAGRLFIEHLGEAVFRNDIDNSVPEMGDLLTHVGPALAAQMAAAKVFGADRTYFILNGTSTSNKVVTAALLKRGDLVLFDRNNHKSNHQGALQLAGAIPIYLETDRNPQGLIGPIDYDALDETKLREQIRNHPLVTDPEAWKRERPFRLAIVEQCSYDGTIYNTGSLIERIGHLCEYVHFDEAWAGFMKFHPLFAGHFAMGLENLDADSPGIVATQSTHKQLAGFSQASQIHVRDEHIKGQARRTGHRRFNEMFMLHCSTSPFYPLFASLDVDAQMHKGRNGLVLWDDAIRIGIETRKKLRTLKHQFAETAKGDASDWFFDPFVPDVVTITDSRFSPLLDGVRWEDIPTDVLAREPACWALVPDARWHGFRHAAPDWAMTDPNKLTLITPGFDRKTGAYSDTGIPATLLAAYLRENNIVPEKCDLNSILFLLTPAVEAGKCASLISRLVAFKHLYDTDAVLEAVLPTTLARYPQRYAGYTLRRLCDEMHGFYRKHDIASLQRLCFRGEHFPEQAMSVADATEAFVGNRVDYLPLSECKGRISATLALIYPPGIGIVVPGERYDDRAQPMLDYFLVFEEAFNRFPGFEFEVQGVYADDVDGRVVFHTYVVQEST
ncbi:amino acid decarboxylase [Pseudomonas sp. 43NM1]|uniref:ornithine decarboxylase n=1 Tax=Pseudomonas sp. 43NM1 TaxID=1904755 RepID=UPI000C33AB64|nr:ornithine decarboxylase [Pseudomonas sp. 43NM1]PKH39692.1 amino acid decarboxylase [Pseudomonas sp. 43NM1]